MVYIKLEFSETKNYSVNQAINTNFFCILNNWYGGALHNRYITGRGIEFNNEKNLLLGLSEVTIYSGKNRPFDIAYLNPMSTHLELELNDRQNNLGTGTGNGVWQLSFDYKSFNKLRFLGNYLFDEFTLDKKQTYDGKGSGRAFSLKSTYPIINDKESILIIYATHISVGTNTFQTSEWE